MVVINQPSLAFSTRQVVSKVVETLPYVGFEKTNDLPDGWIYDIKRWSSLFDLKLPSLPKLSDPDFQGVKESEYFQSGVGDLKQKDLLIEQIAELFYDFDRLWVPVLSPGWYFRFKTQYYLYSDNSRIQYVDPDENRDSRSYVELEAKPDIVSPILAATYNRNIYTHSSSYKTQVEQQYVFSGVYVNGEEQETVTTGGTLLWGNVDTTKKEFIVDHSVADKTILRFNKDYTRVYGVVPDTYVDLGACKQLGLSNGKEYQSFYLPHFPVLADDTFYLYAGTSSTTWEELERVDTWYDLLDETYVYPGAKKFYLDKDYGVVYFGSDINSSTVPVGMPIIAAYTTTLRIEYEEENQEKKIIGIEANTSPVTQYVNQGFVCITHEPLEAAAISLTTNRESVLFSDPKEFGPVYVGTDYAVLEAKVSDYSGSPVSGTEVGFTMAPSTIGLLDGDTETIGVTTSSGKAFSSYISPLSAEDIGHYSTTVRASTHLSYPNSKELIISTSLYDELVGHEDDLYIYQILKDDLFLGYEDLDSYLEDEVGLPSWVPSVASPEYIQWKSEMIEEYRLQEWQGVLPDGTIPGRKVVLYQTVHDITAAPAEGTDNVDGSAINPVTGLASAVVPVRPQLIEKITDTGDAHVGKYRVIYPEDALPDPDPSDPGYLIGGYWVVSSRLIEIKAHCYSPYYGNIIYSNKLYIRVQLPSYLLGEYVASNLDKIPFGWKVLTDSDGVAAGIDGATYITINPYSGPYEILDLVNGTDPEPAPDGWAQAPFKSIGLTFTVVDS